MLILNIVHEDLVLNLVSYKQWISSLPPQPSHSSPWLCSPMHMFIRSPFNLVIELTQLLDSQNLLDHKLIRSDQPGLHDTWRCTWVHAQAHTQASNSIFGSICHMNPFMEKATLRMGSIICKILSVVRCLLFQKQNYKPIFKWYALRVNFQVKHYYSRES